MSTFGNSPDAVLVDPVTHGPVVGSECTVWTSDPTQGAAAQITDLQDLSGTTLPGVVTSDSSGRIPFKTITQYDHVYLKDALGNVYRLTSTEVEDESDLIVSQFPTVQQQAQDALTQAQEAVTSAENALAQATQALDFATQAAATVGANFGTINAQTLTPQFVAELHPVAHQVQQTATKDSTDGTWYLSQAVGGGPAQQDAYVSRMNDQGQFLGAVICKYAGHGTVLGLQHIQGVTYVWLAWSTVDANGNTTSWDTVRFPWPSAASNGATVTKNKTDADVEVISNFSGGGYTLAVIDEVADRVVFRRAAGTLLENYTLYKLSDVEAGVEAPIYPTPVGPISNDPANGGSTMQGFTFLGDTLYRYSGANTMTNGVPTEPPKIWAYDFATGDLMYTRTFPQIGQEPDGTWDGGYLEPEGVSIYRSPNGRLALMMGVTVGAQGWRRYKQYALAEGDMAGSMIGRETEFLNSRLRNVSDGMIGRLTGGGTNGVARIPNGETKIQNLTKPGWYYLPAAAFAAMTDQPSDAGSLGAYLLNSPYSSSDGDSDPDHERAQILIYNRAVQSDGTQGPIVWIRKVKDSETAPYWSCLTLTTQTAFI